MVLETRFLLIPTAKHMMDVDSAVSCQQVLVFFCMIYSIFICQIEYASCRYGVCLLLHNNDADLRSAVGRFNVKRIVILCKMHPVRRFFRKQLVSGVLVFALNGTSVVTALQP